MSNETEDMDLNDSALAARYGEPAELPEENEPELPDEEEVIEETTQSGAATEDTGGEAAGDEEAEVEEEAEGEAQVQPAETTKTSEAATADDPWKARFEELELQLKNQQTLYQNLLEKNAPAPDPDLLKLFGTTEKKEEAAPVPSAPAAATPRIDPVDSLLKEHMLSEPLPFFQTEAEVNAFNSGDVNAMNFIFSRILNTCLDRSVRAAVKVIPPVVGEQTNRQSIIEAYFRERPHLAPHRAQIGAMVSRYSGLRPDLSLAEIMTLLTPEITKTFTGGATQTKQAQPAAPRGPRGPKVKPQGGRFQPQAVGAGNNELDVWLAAKKQGKI